MRLRVRIVCRDCDFEVHSDDPADAAKLALAHKCSKRNKELKF